MTDFRVIFHVVISEKLNRNTRLMTFSEKSEETKTLATFNICMYVIKVILCSCGSEFLLNHCLTLHEEELKCHKTTDL